ncbi:ARM repeat-containing protein [Ramicandelaber brevisporus]|nr:ARM repeat-containing protein [Ramicandelaber brevisporus]
MTSVNPQEAATQLLPVLEQLMSTNNAARQAAESALESVWANAQPNSLMRALIFLIRNVTDDNMRAFACIMTRRSARKTLAAENKEDTRTVWTVISADTKEYCKAELLTALEVEPANSVRKKLYDAIADIASICHEIDEPWERLPQVLTVCMNSEHAAYRESAFKVFNSCLHLLHSESIDAVTGALANALRDSDSNVRMAASETFTRFALEASDAAVPKLQQLMTPLLEVLNNALQSGDEVGFADTMENIVAMTSDRPQILRKHAETLVPFCLATMANKDFEERTRSIALEELVTLCESCPALMRKQAGFLETIVPNLLEMIADIDDDKDWYTSDSPDNSDEGELKDDAETSLDRIACALGGKRLVPILFPLIQTLFRSAEWQQRQAGLLAIMVVCEGAHKQLESQLTEIVNVISPFVQDPHPRVRNSLILCIGQMCDDFRGTLQGDFHKQILDIILPLLGDVQNPRVQNSAAMCLINFASGCDDPALLEGYLESIFQRLLPLLNAEKRYLLEQVVTTIAALADSAQVHFVRYYNDIMPTLLEIIRKADGPDFRLLRGKAIECATYVGRGVGVEVFSQHAETLLMLMAETQRITTEADDPVASYLVSSWGRVCSVIKEKFLPFMDFVIPGLAEVVAKPPEYVVFDKDDVVDEAQYSSEDGWEFVNMEDSQLGLRTSLLDEKQTAVEMVGLYAEVLGRHFGTNAQRLFDSVVKLINFMFHEGVRAAAMITVPQLLKAIIEGQVEPVDQSRARFELAFTQFCNAMVNEDDPEIMLALNEGLQELLQLSTEPMLAHEKLVKFTNSISAGLHSAYKRVKNRDDLRRSQDFDAEDEDALMEEEENEEEVLLGLTRVMNAMLRTHTRDFLPLFEKLVPTIDSFLNAKNPNLRHTGLAIYIDLLESAREHALPLAEKFVPHFIKGISDKMAHIRQGASFGIGVCAIVGGQALAQACIGALPALFSVVEAHGSRFSENIHATENCISAIGKIIRAYPTMVDPAVISAWVKLLPVKNDEDEMSPVYTLVAELAAAQNPQALGANGENVPALVGHLAEAIVSGSLKDAALQASASAMSSLLASCPPDVRNQIFTSLPVQTQTDLVSKGFTF